MCPRGVTWGAQQSPLPTVPRQARMALIALVFSMPITGLPGTASAEAAFPAYESRPASINDPSAQTSMRSVDSVATPAPAMAVGGQLATVTDGDKMTIRWQPVGNDSLDALRGGFDLGGGMSIAFGLTRTVTINGNLVTTTSIQIPDISQLTANQSAALSSHLGRAQVVQNSAVASAEGIVRIGGATGATIIQNSLDNQSIKSTTTINANVGSLSLLKAFNTQSVVRDAVVNAITSR